MPSVEFDLCEFWSCYICGYFGNAFDYDKDGMKQQPDEACPSCGCTTGNGFGMAENDPLYCDSIITIRSGIASERVGD